MSKVIDSAKFKGYIFSDDHTPAHVHFFSPKKKNAEAHCKIEIETQKIVKNEGYKNRELKVLQSLVKSNIETLMEVWNEVQNEQE